MAGAVAVREFRERIGYQSWSVHYEATVTRDGVTVTAAFDNEADAWAWAWTVGEA